MKFGEQFNDKELEIIKDLLTAKLDSIADPGLPQLLSKDLAYLKHTLFHGKPEDVITIQTALRKTIEEIILRQANDS